MRYPASEKLEIIRTVERSHLPTKKTLDMLGIPRSTYYCWYDLYVDGGLDALADRSPCPKSVWNRIPQQVRDGFIEFALDHEALTPRELAVKYTDEKRYFISERPQQNGRFGRMMTFQAVCTTFRPCLAGRLSASAGLGFCAPCAGFTRMPA